MMEIKVKPRTVQTVVAKTLKIHLKVCDNFTASLVDGNGQVIHEQDDGYVPSFMPGEHFGDYVILDIDVDTGMILNWPKSPRLAEGLKVWVEGEET
jgi:hypothetical protein